MAPLLQSWVILFVDLVSDDILQMALRSDLLKKFGGGILHNIDQRHLLHLHTTSSRAIIKENWETSPDILYKNAGFVLTSKTFGFLNEHA